MLMLALRQLVAFAAAASGATDSACRSLDSAIRSDTVPAVAPDTEPAWFADDSSYAPQLTLKRVAQVAFIPGTSRSQRQAAIDSVGGSVIGGYHIPGDIEGTYYILVPSATTDTALVSALQKLTRQPGVKYAEFHLRLKPGGHRPNAGALECCS
jgi:hypothetical protein